MSDISLLSSVQASLYIKIYNKLFDVLENFYETNKHKSVSILLSGGYDSRFVLYLCEKIGIDVSCCYTFSIKDYLSTDAITAKKVCEAEGVSFKLVELPTNFDIIRLTMRELAEQYNCKSKTDFECTFPLYYVYREIVEDIVLTGTDADCYFGLGKKYALHYKKLDDGLTKFRYDMFNGKSNGQIYQRKALSAEFNKISFDPFYQFEVREVFEGTTWQELNVPFKKGPLYTPFKDKFDSIPPYRSSYQCGDTGIRELCAEALLTSKYNTQNYKSVVGCYNELVRRTKNGNTSKLF